MFNKNNKSYTTLKILFLSFLIFSIISFILSSFYDIEINKWFAKGMDIYWLKMLSWVYEEIGMTQSYLFIFLFIAIYFEIKVIERKDKKSWKYVLWIFYIAVLIFWITANSIWIATTTKIDDGFGVGISGWFLESYDIRQIILIVLFLIESIAIAITFWYIRFIFIKKPYSILCEYKVDTIKAFSAFIFSSFVVFSMKVIFGRPYFYSVDFENIFYSDRVEPLWKQYWLETGHKIKSWGVINQTTGRVNGVEYLEWWQINNFFSNIGDLFAPLGTGKAGWWNLDFPSGHMISFFTMIYASYFFIGRNRKINWKIWSVVIIWFIHLNIVQYTQIISRTHWISDTSFSIILCLVILIFNGKIIDLLRQKITNNKKNKEHKEKKVV
ncbi:phosphatase PAP2 family protein [Spiroplasma endosymbiont of Atherix ibis]|uniref:phosphatase PAP2 family protein n=1 Tax=Spiroplasma endosymbiont of Atherix ibis TaxID=3066291 RepID=UPI0030D5BD44